MYRIAALQMLSEADRTAYSHLQALIARSTFTSPRNQRVKSFAETLEIIRRFVMRDDPEDSLRGLVCGLYWLPDGIAVDVHEVRLLVPRCKSSIHGSLHKLGYTLSLGRLECAEVLTKIFPLVRDQTAELRKWSIRKIETQRTSMVLPVLVQPVIGDRSADLAELPGTMELAEKWDRETNLDHFFNRYDQFGFG
jgi:hypothetical protein